MVLRKKQRKNRKKADRGQAPERKHEGEDEAGKKRLFIAVLFI